MVNFLWQFLFYFVSEYEETNMQNYFVLKNFQFSIFSISSLIMTIIIIIQGCFVYCFLYPEQNITTRCNGDKNYFSLASLNEHLKMAFNTYFIYYLVFCRDKISYFNLNFGFKELLVNYSGISGSIFKKTVNVNQLKVRENLKMWFDLSPKLHLNLEAKKL